MKKLLAIGAVVLSLGVVTPAYAVNFTVDDYTVTLHNAATPGLIVTATDVMVDNFSFDLSTLNQQQTFNLFQISTAENTLENDDEVSLPINVNFAFSAPPPAFNGNAGGTTVAGYGFFNGCPAFTSCGHLDWANESSSSALLVSFGTTGQLAIWLTNEEFGLPGSDIVQATFQLRRLDTPVAPTAAPEPGSLVLLGSGLLFGAARLRKKMKGSAPVA